MAQRSTRIGIAAVLLAVGLTVVQRLDAALAAMHQVGERSLAASALASPGVLRSRAERLAAIEASWKAWDELAIGGSSWATLLGYVVVDVALIAVPLAMLLLLLRQVAVERGEQLGAEIADRRQLALAAADLTTAQRDAAIAAGEAAATEEGRAQAALEAEIAEAARERYFEDAAQAAISQQRLPTVMGLLGLVPVAVAAYLAADVAETVPLLTLHRWTVEGTLLAVGLFSAVKWLALAAAVIPLALVTVGTRPARASSGRALSQRAAGLADEVVALRAQASVVLLLAGIVLLPGDTGKQIDDAVLLLYGEPWKALGLIAAVAVLCALIWASGRRCLAAYQATDPPSEAPLPWWAVAATAGPGLALLAFGAALAERGFVALVAPGALLLLFAVFSAPVRDARARLWGQVRPRLRVLWWLVGAPPLLLGLVALRSGVLVMVAGDGRWGWFVVAGALGVLAGFGLAQRAANEPLDGVVLGPTDLAVGAGAAALVAGLSVAGAWDPGAVGEALGPWTVLLVFGAAALLVVSALVVAGDRIPARGMLAVAGFRRTPLVLALLVCFVATSFLDSGWRYHETRLAAPIDRDDAALGDLDAALDDWHARVTGNDPDAAVHPMVFVASSGGGIRAAYWTAGLLSCLLSGSPGLEPRGEDPLAGEPGCDAPSIPDPEQVFLASGISGGSVGLAVTRALDDDPRAYTHALSLDFLGATVAGFAFRDAPNAFLRLDGPADRAAILEDAWSRGVAAAGGDLDCGFLVASRRWDDGPCGTSAPEGEPALRFPILLLHSAAVDDACRLTVSSLDLARPLGPPGPEQADASRDCSSLAGLTVQPGQDALAARPAAPQPRLVASRDVHDHTCAVDGAPRDVTLATAAHLSARFPWVSPTGALESCAEPGRRSHAMDGGLLDVSAAEPIAELWPAIFAKLHEWNVEGDSCVAPRLILMDNGYVRVAPEAPPDRPQELLAPVQAAERALGARTPAARQAAAVAFERAFADVPCGPPTTRVAHFYPLSHPGPQAPLGWTLSAFSRDDLRRELANDHNQRQFALVRSWFAP